jgi:hypothetical protein
MYVHLGISEGLWLHETALTGLVCICIPSGSMSCHVLFDFAGTIQYLSEICLHLS